MKIPRLRWIICSLLFLATALCFLDRQVLSMVAETICKEFHMDKVDYGYVTTAFLVSYALMFLVGGKLVDYLGTRWGLGLSVAFWTISSAVHGLIYTPFQLGIARFCLGLGEGACFPGAAKAVAEWFPKKERALATGIAIGGASLGGVVAPPLTVFCLYMIGWRGTFFLTGLLGAIWVALWFFFYYHPRKSPLITKKESDYILEVDAPQSNNAITASIKTNDTTEEEKSCLEKTGEEDTGHEDTGHKDTGEKATFWQLFTRADVLGLAFARFLFDPVFYLYMFWIPSYLETERGLSAVAVGKLAWIPFFALGVSNILGGWLSDRFVRSGVAPLKARKTVMALAAAATMASGLAAFAPTVYFAIGMMAILMFAHGFWITNYVTIISDRFHGSLVGTVMGITGMVGTIGGMFANTTVGFVVHHFSYFPIWIASGCLYPLAFIVILLTIRQKKTSV